MKQNEDGTLSFGAMLDLSGVDEAAEKLNAKISSIGDNAESASAKIDQAFQSIPTVKIDILSNVDETLSKIGEAFTEIDRVIDTNKAAIADLEKQYDELGEKMSEAYMKGDDDTYRKLNAEAQAIRNTIRLRKQLISETEKVADSLSAFEQEVKKEAEEVSKAEVKHSSLRQRIKELKMELIEMEASGQRNTDKYREMQEEVGRLTDAWGDATAQANILAHDQRGMQGIISGLSGLSGAFSAAQGVIALFGDENEDLQRIMMRVQSAMAITMGLQQLQQTLDKDSAFQLVTLNGLREWWNKILAIGRGEMEADTAATIADNAAKESSTIATEANAAAQRLKASATSGATAATGANTAADVANTGAAVASTGANIGLAGSFRMIGAAIKSLMASIPILGWIALGVTAIYEAYSHFSKKAEEAKKAIKEQQEMMKNANETFAKAKVGIDDAIRSLEKFNGTQDQEKKLISDLNSKYGQTLGYHKSRAEWLEILKTKGANYCQMLMMEAQAQAILNKYTEAYINLLSVKNNAENGEYDHWYNTKAGDQIARQKAIDEAQGEVDKWEAQYKELQQQILDFKSQNDFNFHIDPNSAKGGKNGNAFDPKKSAAEMKKIMEAYRDEVKKYIKDANDDITDAIIQSQEDGLTKELNISRQATARRIADWKDNLRKLAEVRKETEHQIYMQQKGATEDGWLNSDAGKMSTEQYMESLLKDKKISEEFYRGLSLIVENGEREIAAIRQNYADSLIDAYGTTQQKMEKLEREWAQKLKYIPSEYLDEAIKQMEASFAQLQSDDFKKAIDWDAIFGDMGKHSADALKLNLERIKKYFEDNKSSMDATEIRNYQEAITKMEDEIASRNPFSALRKSIDDMASAKTELTNALAEMASAQREVNEAQTEFNAALEYHREILDRIDNGELTADCEELADATRKETDARNKLTQATQRNIQAENKVVNARNKLTSSYKSFATHLKSVGGAVTDVGGKAKDLAQVFSADLANSIEKGLDFTDKILDATSSVIDAVSDVGKSAAQGIEATVDAAAAGATGAAAAGAAAISMIEKASVILAVISAALQVATAIASLFNDDDAKQEEIENLQRRIDQLQWELDNQDAVRLQNRLGDAVERVRNVYAQTSAEVMRLHEVSKRYGSFWGQMIGQMIYENEMMERSINKIADAYAKVEYTANKALGEERFKSTRKQLENLAEQQILIYKQIEEEQSKKDVDQDKIDDWKRDIQELANEMADLINEMLEEIIGSTAQDLSSELGKAFFDAAAQGEDAMEAWHQKVNDIVRDILQRMLISQVLEPRIGQLFDKYKKRWFDDKGNFQGIDAVKNSASQFASDLNQAGELMREMWDGLSEDMKQYFSPEEVGREAAARGLATASQDSVDENNARLTTIQGHTYTLVQGVNDLNATANAILDKVTSIDRTTQNMDRTMDETKKVVKNLQNAVDDINMKGIKLK